MSTSGIAHKIANEAALARALLQLIAETAGDDDDTQVIVIEGETNLIEAIASAVDRIAELEAHAAAITSQISTMRDRKSRFDAAVERLRGSIRAALETTGMPKIELPRATISLRSAPPKLEIINASAIPADCLRQPPPEVDKKAVLVRLKSGQSVPGATLLNGGETIVIRFG